jgi:hypothetical protein
VDAARMELQHDEGDPLLPVLSRPDPIAASRTTSASPSGRTRDHHHPPSGKRLRALEPKLIRNALI